MDRMLNDFVESIEFDFATIIDTTSAPMNEKLNNKGDLYRDQHFAQAMEEFEMNMNLDDLNIFPPSAKTYHFARSIQQIEGLVRIARQYMKKLAS